MTFKKFLLGYMIFWVVLIVGVCIWEWNALGSFQADYEVDADDGVPSILDVGQVLQPETTGATVAEKAQIVEFVADSTMSILVNGEPANATLVEEVEDIIYEAVAEATGIIRTKNKYQLELISSDVLMVLDSNGNEIVPVDNDYVAGIYVTDQSLSQIAIEKVEVYIKHINGLVALDQMGSVMRSESAAYKAVRSSQESLKWIVPATDMAFVNEETDNMQIFDETHFACDVNIDLTKKANSSSGREYVVDESVSYRVLYECINGNWYIYSFQTK